VRIAIVGAGVGGLTLALMLRARDLPAEVFEQAGQLAEIGAAVALSANANREFARLGLLDGIAAHAWEPSELIWRDGADGRRIAAHSIGLDGRYRTEFGAPYFGVHRADLQAVLSGALPPERLHLGHRLTGIEERAGEIRLAFANGHTAAADLVIGADGVRSTVRGWITGPGGPGARYSGTSAFRGIVPTASLRSLPDPGAIQFWAGPDAHLLHYPIGPGGEHINFFAVKEGPQAWPGGDRWTIDETPKQALEAFAGWEPAVTEMIAASSLHSRWGLFVTAPLRRWHRGSVVLIGDAAHGMLPHHGQGANTTVEDAAVLAELIAQAPASAEHENMLGRYQDLRMRRTRIIQRSAWDTNRVLHLPVDVEPPLQARAERLARFPEQFGWIHAFDANASLTA
jgi:salicylate hydroxylase